MPRLFFAVELESEVKAAIQGGIDRIGIEKPPWRWVSQDNFHITLKFIGECPAARVGDLCTVAQLVADAVPQFDLTLDVLGGFPSLRSPRVLFYRVNSGVEALGELARKLDATLAARLRMPEENRPFRAHATIARIKGPIRQSLSSRLVSSAPLEKVSQAVTEMVLMESHLAREGATYHRVKGFALQKSKC